MNDDDTREVQTTTADDAMREQNEAIEKLVGGVDKLIDTMPHAERFGRVSMFFGVVLDASKLTAEESFRAFLLHAVTTKGIPSAKLTYPLPDGSEQVIEAKLPPRTKH